MKLATFSMIFLLILEAIHSINEVKISKVICSFVKNENADILKGTLTQPIRLSKQLIKECSIKNRILPYYIRNIGRIDNLISFASEENDNKETL